MKQNKRRKVTGLGLTKLTIKTIKSCACRRQQTHHTRAVWIGMDGSRGQRSKNSDGGRQVFKGISARATSCSTVQLMQCWHGVVSLTRPTLSAADGNKGFNNKLTGNCHSFKLNLHSWLVTGQCHCQHVVSEKVLKNAIANNICTWQDGFWLGSVNMQ